MYCGAVVGAGVLVLPGVAADRAGPASLLAWLFDGALGLPIALTFARLATRYPDAGGVATFATHAFGSATGAVIGWFYFAAAAVGQEVVTLTGAHYAAAAAGWGRIGTYGLAGATLAAAVIANLFGLRVSARLQLALAGAVGLILVATTLVALPRARQANLHPFIPHGWHPVAQVGVLLFFAFFGWEAITHLTAEFHDPARDVRRATLISVFVITAAYLGVAFAVVATHEYGGVARDRVAVMHVLVDSAGRGVEIVAPTVACLIALGTTNAFVAAVSRLGYALGRDGAFPPFMARQSRDGVPFVAVAMVGLIAWSGLIVGYEQRLGAEAFLVVPNSLTIIVYIVGMLAGMRLLAGGSRLIAGAAAALSAALIPFIGLSLLIPLVVASMALAYRRARR